MGLRDVRSDTETEGNSLHTVCAEAPECEPSERKAVSVSHLTNHTRCCPTPGPAVEAQGTEGRPEGVWRRWALQVSWE